MDRERFLAELAKGKGQFKLTFGMAKVLRCPRPAAMTLPGRPELCCCPLNFVCGGWFANYRIGDMADHLGMPLALARSIARAADDCCDTDEEHLLRSDMLRVLGLAA